MSPLAALRLTLADLPREPAGAKPFVLDRDALWVLRSGRVDVFYVDGRPGTRNGRRRHLFRVEAPGVVVGMRIGAAEVETGVLQATCTYGTRLRAFPLPRFRELQQRPEARPELARLVEGWSEMLCRAIAGAVLPQQCIDVPIGSRLDVSAGASIRPGGGVAWIAGLPPDARLFGEASLSVGNVGVLPLSPRAWIEIPHESTIEVRETLSVVEHDEVWTGLACLQRLALARAQHRLDAGDEREGERQRKKGEAGRARLVGAFRQIASGLETDGPAAAVPVLTKDA